LKGSFRNLNGWPLFEHESIRHEPLTALEQWKASRHRLLWVAVVNRDRGQTGRSRLSPYQTRDWDWD